MLQGLSSDWPPGVRAPTGRITGDLVQGLDPADQEEVVTVG
jgi:hypothetical protein